MNKVVLVLVVGCLAFSCQQKANVSRSESVSEASKLCALTFDDGPNVELTSRVLDKLEKYGVVATFFVIGTLVNETTKPVLDRMVKMGCEIGNHSCGWNSMDSLSPEQIKESVNKTTEAIKKYTGKAPKFFRPPNLATSQRMYDVIDMPFAGGVLGFDWAGCENRTPEGIASNVLKEMRDGAIILLHDVQPEPHPTAEALDILIPELKKQGYEFVTLSELFKRKGVDPKSLKGQMWKYVF